jgi:hypothetical protein
MLGNSSFAVSSHNRGLMRRVTFEPESGLRKIEESCFEMCSLALICIPRWVEVLGKYWFSSTRAFTNHIGKIVLERQSHLRRIEDSCFEHCSLKAIRIPPSVEVLGDRCFAGSKSHRNEVGILGFGSESPLQKIGDECFDYCSLKSIFVPRSVDIIGRSCFTNVTTRSDRFVFQGDSRLREIGSECFKECRLRSFCIPGHVKMVCEKCFSWSHIHTLTFDKGLELS